MNIENRCVYNVNTLSAGSLLFEFSMQKKMHYSTTTTFLFKILPNFIIFQVQSKERHSIVNYLNICQLSKVSITDVQRDGDFELDEGMG